MENPFQPWMASLINAITKSFGMKKILAPPLIPSGQCPCPRCQAHHLLMDLAFLETSRRLIVRRLTQSPPASKETIKAEIMQRITGETMNFRLN